MVTVNLRRAARVLGTLLILVGIGMLGYVAWQFYGTTWTSKHKYDEIQRSLEEQWARGEPVARTPDGTSSRALLRIPRFGEDYQVPITDGTGDAALAAGVGHFEHSAGPGKRGNFALAGHRVTRGQPFRDFPELRPGDTVEVVTKNKVFTYVLDTGGADLEVPFTETWVVDARPENPAGGVGPKPGEDRLITLTTCAELFHTDGRLIAFGHLDSVARR